MASPLTIGITATVVAPIKRKRESIRFQNTSASQTIYIKKVPLEGAFSVVSPTDYEVLLQPSVSTSEAGEAFETNSIASFMAVASAAAGTLAVYETVKVK